MPRGKKGKRKSSTPLSDNEEEEEQQVSQKRSSLSLSQQPAGTSQDILPPKASEQRNLDNLPEEEREKVLMDLSRLILFKALAGETMDRKLVCKEAGLVGSEKARISSAAFAIAAERLKNTFGFELKRLPPWMAKQKAMTKKYAERHYLVLQSDDIDSQYSKDMYGIHRDVQIQKGFLMIVLAFIFCKGEQRSDGSRWILDTDLYRLLHLVDDNIPKDPPAPGSKKNGGGHGSSRFVEGEDAGQGGTPNVDRQLDQFVKIDYLLKQKIDDEDLATQTTAEEHSHWYAMGPRAALEIGRKQVVYFCAEIMDLEPDQEMLDEIEREEKEAEEEQELADEG